MPDRVPPPGFQARNWPRNSKSERQSGGSFLEVFNASGGPAEERFDSNKDALNQPVVGSQHRFSTIRAGQPSAREIRSHSGIRVDSVPPLAIPM